MAPPIFLLLLFFSVAAAGGGRDLAGAGYSSEDFAALAARSGLEEEMPELEPVPDVEQPAPAVEPEPGVEPEPEEPPPSRASRFWRSFVAGLLTMSRHMLQGSRAIARALHLTAPLSTGLHNSTALYD